MAKTNRPRSADSPQMVAEPPQDVAEAPQPVAEAPAEPEETQPVQEPPAEPVQEPVSDPVVEEITPAVEAVPDPVAATAEPEVVPEWLEKFKSAETIPVKRVALIALYNRLLRNKAQFYCGAGAKRLLGELLGIEGEDVATLHNHFRDNINASHF